MVVLEINLESKCHRAHLYRERQKERKRKVRVARWRAKFKINEDGICFLKKIMTLAIYVLITREVITKMVAKMTDSIKED